MAYELFFCVESIEAKVLFFSFALHLDMKMNYVFFIPWFAVYFVFVCTLGNPVHLHNFSYAWCLHKLVSLVFA